MSAPDPLLGKKIGHVVVRRLVGRGGMGSVYEGYQENLDRRVAVKVISPERLDDPVMLARFRREALSVARLSHPNIVRIYDAVDEGDLHCLIMEFLEGDNLKHLLREGALEVQQAIAYGIDIAEGLWHAHSQDPPIIHRDIKSENIIISPEGCARITDFGAVLLPDTGMKTRTGMVVGTPEYMSPEQVRGLPLDFRSDLYSLGVVLFETLTGQLPFSSEQRFEIARRQVQELPVSPRALQSDLPEDLATVVLKALEKDRGQRYQSAADLLADLKLMQIGERIKTKISYKPSTLAERHTVQAPRASETTATLVGPDTRTVEIERELLLRRQRRRLSLPIALVALALLAGGLYLAWQSLRADTVPPVGIFDLAAAPGLDPGQVELAWTAPFEDYDGRVNRYEIRALDHPFERRTLNEARDLSSFAPAPEPAGEHQRAVLKGLAEGQRYYFTVFAYDRAGNPSPLSNPAFCLPKGIPPAAVKEFSARYEQGAVQLEWRASGDDGDAGGPAARYFVLMHSEPITELNWNSALDKSPAPLPPASPGEWMRVTLPDVPAGQYFFGVRACDDVGELGPVVSSLRVQVGESRDTIPPSPVADLAAEPGTAAGSVHLSWTAPGDDGAEGAAFSYLVRVATAPIAGEDDWQRAQAVARVIAPATTGTRQAMAVLERPEGMMQYFGLRAVDEAGNVGPLGNSPGSRATDIPPAPITDLRADTVVKAGACQVTLRWSAPGDDGREGRASRYELREGDSPMGDSDWEKARALRESPPAPGPAGREESMTLVRRETGRVYYAVRAFDDAGNAASVSNSAVCDLSDTIAPDKPGQFAAKPAGDDAVELSWLAPGDDGARGQATRYELYWDRQALNENNWKKANRVAAGLPKPGEVYSPERARVDDLAESGDYTFALAAVDDRGNASPPAFASARLAGRADTTPPERVSSLAARAVGDDVELTWNAPTDPGWSRGLSRYEIRYREGALDAASWASATVVAATLEPRLPGQKEVLLLSGLRDNAVYSFALVVYDKARNQSGLSNPATARIPPHAAAAQSAEQKEVLGFIKTYQAALNTWNYDQVAAHWSPDINDDHMDEVQSFIRRIGGDRRSKVELEPGNPSISGGNHAVLSVRFIFTWPDSGNPNGAMQAVNPRQMVLRKINGAWKVDKVTE